MGETLGISAIAALVIREAFAFLKSRGNGTHEKKVEVLLTDIKDGIQIFGSSLEIAKERQVQYMKQMDIMHNDLKDIRETQLKAGQ